MTTGKSARKVVPVTPRPTHLPPKLSHSPLSSRDEPSGDLRPLNYHTNIGFWRGRQLSFGAALAGVAYIVRTQPNVWIELAATMVVVIAGLWFGVSAVEWSILGLTVAMILALEAVNTAIESLVDLVSPQYDPLAKIAKDTAAGALLLAVLGSLFVAACIFGPQLWQLLL